MPYLSIQTNTSVDHETQEDVLKRASTLVASKIGKSEKYVMTALNPEQLMMFAGSDEPCAYLELKSIGLPLGKTTALSQALCDFIEDALKVSADRIYIEFTDAPRAMWGWNRKSF